MSAHVNLHVWMWVCVPIESCLCPDWQIAIRPSRVICNLLEVWPKFPGEPEVLVQEGSPRPGGRLWASLSQLAELWRVPAKVWDSVTETAVGLLHSQTMMSVFVLCVCWWRSNLTATTWVANDKREKSVFESDCMWEYLDLVFLNNSLFGDDVLIRVCLCTCLCHSGCPDPASLSQSEESSDCDQCRWTGCYSEGQEE